MEDHDPEAVLRAWWDRNTGNEPDTEDEPAVPAGMSWPEGPAPTPPSRADPDEHADAVADRFLVDHPAMRLGLVAAGSGAEALTAVGWLGPNVRTDDIGKLAAVVRDWEKRYGARVLSTHPRPARRVADRRRGLGVLVVLAMSQHAQHQFRVLLAQYLR